MQAAYHGPIRIEHAQAGNVDRAHQSDRPSLIIDRRCLPADIQGAEPDFDLSFPIERMVSLPDIQVFQQGVMIKVRVTTIFFTTVALESVMIRRRLVLSIHSPVKGA